MSDELIYGVSLLLENSSPTFTFKTDIDDIREDYIYVKEPLVADDVDSYSYREYLGPGSGLHSQLPQLRSTSDCSNNIYLSSNSVALVSNLLFYTVIVCSAFCANLRKL